MFVVMLLDLKYTNVFEVEFCIFGLRLLRVYIQVNDYDKVCACLHVHTRWKSWPHPPGPH